MAGSNIKKVNIDTDKIKTYLNENKDKPFLENVANVVVETYDEVLENTKALDEISNIEKEKDFSNYTKILNGALFIGAKPGENSQLYYSNENGEVVGSITLDTIEEIKNISSQDNIVTVETISGEKTTYDTNRIVASIALAQKYEGSNTGKYYETDGQKVVEVANFELGKDYVYGAVGPDAYDCSGFVGYCVTGKHERIGSTYTFMEWPETSNPQPGDICVNENHTGIYIGDGQMIHAATEGVGVIIGPVQSGMKYVVYPGDENI